MPPPRWFVPRIARVGLALFVVVALGVWGRALHESADEAMDVVHLLDAAPTASVLALPFHDRSDPLDEDNSIGHYFPVYHLAIHGGLTSLFWGNSRTTSRSATSRGASRLTRQTGTRRW